MCVWCVVWLVLAGAVCLGFGATLAYIVWITRDDWGGDGGEDP